MFNFKKGMIAAIIAGMSMNIVPAFAAEMDEVPLDTTVGITACYSTDITPAEDDIFSITLTGSSSGEVNVDFNASQYADLTQSITVKPDNYKITNIEYKGSNEAILSEGFSMNNTFSVMEGEYADVTLAIGTDEGMLLNSIYDSTITYQNGEIVNGRSAFMQEAASEQPEVETETRIEDEPEETSGNEETQDAAKEDGTEKREEPSAIEKDAKVIYEEPEEYEETESMPLFMRAVPLFCAAGITALVIFILHKKGKI